MMMRDKGKLVIWPVYLDQTKSRSSGRIISRKNAIKEAYPKSWWEVSGRVLVDDKGPKSVIAKQIALAIKKMRGQESPAKT